MPTPAPIPTPEPDDPYVDCALPDPFDSKHGSVEVCAHPDCGVKYKLVSHIGWLNRRLIRYPQWETMDRIMSQRFRDLAIVAVFVSLAGLIYYVISGDTQTTTLLTIPALLTVVLGVLMSRHLRRRDPRHT